jgi:tetratricopeptide (TPR) repeat protein
MESEGGSLHGIGLSLVSLGKAYASRGNNDGANIKLNEAISLLHKSGIKEFLINGLIARASINRKKFSSAYQDLEEVFEIADLSKMNTHLTDYHLEISRLFLAEGKPENVQEHIDKAGQLIQGTGYKRRLPELEELKEMFITGRKESRY